MANVKRKFRREVISETQRFLLISNSGEEEVFACKICRGDSVLLSPSLITQILQISEREIFRLIEAGRIHFIEDENRKNFVCLKDLKKHFEKRKKLLH